MYNRREVLNIFIQTLTINRKSTYYHLSYKKLLFRKRYFIVNGSELFMGWVDPWVGFGFVGLGRVEIFQILVGWVGSKIFESIFFQKIFVYPFRTGVYYIRF